MSNKILTTICIAGAVVSAAVAAIVVTNNRASIARAQAEKAENNAEAEKDNRKAQEAEAKAAEDNRKAKEAEAKAAEDNRKAKDSELIIAEKTEKAEADAKERAKLEEEKAREEAQAAADLRAAAKDEADKARKNAEAVRVAAAAEVAESNAVAQAAADQLAVEKLKSDKLLAEAKLLENRKIDFETWQARLLELEQELAERERALTPDVSINDSTNITWVAEREADVIGGDTNAIARLKRKKVSPENDVSLPESTRRLARMERELKEELSAGMHSSSNKIVKSLTRLYVQAVRDGRMVDAEYYRRSLKYYNPNWEYKKP